MNVTLTPEQEKFISEQVKSGHYKSPNDVITQSLGMLRAQEEFVRTHAGELREKIAIGLDQVGQGKVIDGKTAITNLRRKLLGHGRGDK
jgi:antitoxin ParD1/3/4